MINKDNTNRIQLSKKLDKEKYTVILPHNVSEKMEKMIIINIDPRDRKIK